MLELIRYLPVCALNAAQYIVTGNWDHVPKLKEEADKIGLDTFPAAMERQVAEINNRFSEFDKAELSKKETAMPWGKSIKAGVGLVNMCLAPLVAYRMQLFLYAKAAGLSELNSANCWIGVDPKTQEETN